MSLQRRFTNIYERAFCRNAGNRSLPEFDRKFVIRKGAEECNYGERAGFLCWYRAQEERTPENPSFECVRSVPGSMARYKLSMVASAILVVVFVR